MSQLRKPRRLEVFWLLIRHELIYSMSSTPPFYQWCASSLLRYQLVVWHQQQYNWRPVVHYRGALIWGVPSNLRVINTVSWATRTARGFAASALCGCVRIGPRNRVTWTVVGFGSADFRSLLWRLTLHPDLLLEQPWVPQRNTLSTDAGPRITMSILDGKLPDRNSIHLPFDLRDAWWLYWWNEYRYMGL